MRLHDEGFSIDAAIAKGRKLPAWVHDLSDLEPEHSHFARAFWSLHTCRPMGMEGLGPIPWDAAHRYGETLGLRGETLLNFCDVILTMDLAYQEWVAKKRG